LSEAEAAKGGQFNGEKNVTYNHYNEAAMENIDDEEPSLGEAKDLDQLTKDEPDRVDAEEFITEITETTPEPA
jgi:hypothetical protein